MEPLLSWDRNGDGELVVYLPVKNTKKRKALSQHETSDADSGGTSQVPHHLDIWAVTDGNKALTKSRSVDFAPIQLKRPPLTIVHEPANKIHPLCMECLPFQSRKSIALGIKNSVQICKLMPQEDDHDYDYHVMKKFLFGGTRFENRRREGNIAYKEVARQSSHEGRVLGLSINLTRNLIASSSADSIVKLWNLGDSKNVMDLKLHVSEVNAVSWDPLGLHNLLSGSSDKMVVMMDCRVDGRCNNRCTRWKTTSDVKSVAWNPMFEHKFIAHLVNGEVLFFDGRKVSDDLLRSREEESIKAFEGRDDADQISSVAYNPLKNDVIVMGSSAGKFKVLDRNSTRHEPSKVQELCQEKISRLIFQPKGAKGALLAYCCSNNKIGIIPDAFLA